MEKFQNEELHCLYSSSNIVRVGKSRRLRWAGRLARMEECTRAFKILTGIPTGVKPLGRPRCRREDNSRMYFKKFVSIRGIGLLRFRIGIIGVPLWMRH